jgi:potassium/chloride transporter 4/5/6
LKYLIGTIAIAEARQCAVIVPKNIDSFPDNKDIQEGTIDIWWIIHDGGLLFLIAFLLKRNKVWARCRIRLFTVAQLEDNSVEMKKDLEQYMYQLRIEAEVNVIEMVCIFYLNEIFSMILSVGRSRNFRLCI